ncbi:BamA/TamA family outer membrane protein [candidate division KSB1 bacterium]|nr:BamA/TamA family outer membrane protein [candidate division KSB1 bacterium]NIR73140.1 BamA/TamA family outer membrane protein [candidate division KSB1 bacterium]NIS23843.1 BamA/TamA family outer membrane protein [candidate division KSB1 bacterium]NIT70764.1 BamA/TamA family outer membrane protein [candidate division KSB1 bacterium]NIU24492.1 BamA/TamA family outer membrane protein [candidate division KSB1 bacterium]
MKGSLFKFQTRLCLAVCFWAGLIFFSSLSHPSVFGQGRGAPPRLTVEKFEFEGNTKTNDEVILRHLTIQPGDTVNPAVLEANQLRLAQTNFFKDVEFYARPGSEKGKVILVIEVQERHWPYFQFEGGHSDLRGWFFVPASLRFDNFFGSGNMIGLRLVLGDRIGKLSLGFRNSNLFDDTAFWDFELFGGGREFIHYLGSDRSTQDVGFGGLRFQIGGQEGLFKHLNFAYRIETHEPDEFIDFSDLDSTTTLLPPDIADDVQETQIGAFSFILNADLRDNPAYPLNGFWGALSFELAHDELGSDLNFPKVMLDSRFYKRLFGRQVFAFHVKGGYTTDNSPFYERFYLGGANSLRGYPDRRLTPVGWGTKLFRSNAEFRFPLSTRNFPFHKFSGILFFDVGGIWQSGQTPKFDDLFSAAGFGFRYKLPILGMTRFDFSFPLNKVDENDFQFHVSLGHTF